MHHDDPHPVQTQAPDLNISLTPPHHGQRSKGRWWRVLLGLAILGGGAYGLALYLGKGPQLDAWKAQITQTALSLYARLPYIGAGKTSAEQTAGKTGERTKAGEGSKTGERGKASEGGKAGEGSKSGEGGKAADAAGSRVVSVVTATAKTGNMGVYLSALGTVTPFQTVTIRARVDGHIVKIAFQEGQYVRQGDLLAEIDPRPFEVQLAQAEGQMAKDQAQLKNAQVDFERYKVLLAQDSVAKQQLDTQSATVSQYEGVIKSNQAQIDNAKLLLSYSRITAPISGRIGFRMVDLGNMVRANDPNNALGVIVQVQPITVLFNVPEDELPKLLKKVQAGQALVVEAHNRDMKQKLATGKFLTVDNQMDTSTGTVRCKAVFQNDDNSLFPNQFVNVRVLLETKQNAVIVPAAAVQRSRQSTFVYVVKDDTVEVRPVGLGPHEGDTVAIDSGLAAGDVVVTEGVDRVQQGTKVSARPVAGGGAKGKS